jgi:hypothetical protein
MIVTVTNPLDNTEIEIELKIQLNLIINDEVKILNVSATGSKVLENQTDGL